MHNPYLSCVGVVVAQASAWSYFLKKVGEANAARQQAQPSVMARMPSAFTRLPSAPGDNAQLDDLMDPANPIYSEDDLTDPSLYFNENFML
jgi:hypothetical protein